MTATRNLIVFSLLLVGAALAAGAVWLATDRPSRAATSGFAPEAFLVPIQPGARLCVPRQVVPAGSNGVQLTLGSYGRASGTVIRVSGVRAGRQVLGGRLAFREGQNVFVPFTGKVPAETVVDFCLANVGRFPFRVGGKPGFGPSLRFPGANRHEWAGEAGTIAERFQRVRFAPLGAQSLWLFLLPALVALGLAVGAVIRGSRP